MNVSAGKPLLISLSESVEGKYSKANVNFQNDKETFMLNKLKISKMSGNILDNIY